MIDCNININPVCKIIFYVYLGGKAITRNRDTTGRRRIVQWEKNPRLNYLHDYVVIRYPQSVRKPVPPLGQENEIDSFSQTYQHAPHSMHLSSDLMMAFLSFISKHPPRQTLIQFAHPVHVSEFTVIKLPVSETHSTPGMSLNDLIIFLSSALIKQNQFIEIASLETF
jgi:hypothetical protein